MKKHFPIAERSSAHAMTIRINSDYNAYLENLSFATRLDKVQIIRLLIHLAPNIEEFNRIIDEYRGADRKNHYYWVNDWTEKDDLWKWAK